MAGGLFPQQAAAIVSAAIKGNLEEADRCDAAFADLWRLVDALDGRPHRGGVSGPPPGQAAMAVAFPVVVLP